MKIALAQLNYTIGDFEGNSLKMLLAYEKAKKENVDLVVFSEMSICGYPPRDLLERNRFVEQSELALNKLAKQITSPAAIVGTILRNDNSKGKPLYNSAVFIESGKIKSIQHKTLLPTYDVFDEGRYFEPAIEHEPIKYKGKKIALTICEDIWGPYESGDRHIYGIDPVPSWAKKKIDLLINLSASPYSVRKHRLREKFLKNVAEKCKCPSVFCNQVGGNDDLIFDGNSIVMNEKCEIVGRGRTFEEDLIIIDLNNANPVLNYVECTKEEETYKALVLGLRDYAQKCGFKKAVIGISGGIDSALVAALAVEAIGSENITGISMPSKYTSKDSKDFAVKLAKNLSIELKTISIDDIYDRYLSELKAVGSITLAEENIQARIRGNILMYSSNHNGSLVLSTGNKSEVAMGYCTLYGDMAGGLSVLSDLFKSNVYALSEYINRNEEIIPRGIIERPPSAELRPDQKDTDSLPSYNVLDVILKAYVEDRLTEDEIVSMDFDRKLVHDILRKVDNNEYKRRQSAPGLKVSAKAFGTGRRIPIAWKKT